MRLNLSYCTQYPVIDGGMQESSRLASYRNKRMLSVAGSPPAENLAPSTALSSVLAFTPLPARIPSKFPLRRAWLDFKAVMQSYRLTPPQRSSKREGTVCPTTVQFNAIVKVVNGMLDGNRRVDVGAMAKPSCCSQRISESVCVKLEDV